MTRVRDGGRTAVRTPKGVSKGGARWARGDVAGLNRPGRGRILSVPVTAPIPSRSASSPCR
jgi:hypothetical protein